MLHNFQDHVIKGHTTRPVFLRMLCSQNPTAMLWGSPAMGRGQTFQPTAHFNCYPGGRGSRSKNSGPSRRNLMASKWGPPGGAGWPPETWKTVTKCSVGGKPQVWGWLITRSHTLPPQKHAEFFPVRKWKTCLEITRPSSMEADVPEQYPRNTDTQEARKHDNLASDYGPGSLGPTPGKGRSSAIRGNSGP